MYEIGRVVADIIIFVAWVYVGYKVYLKFKADQIKSQKENKELYAEALKAMSRYRPLDTIGGIDMESGMPRKKHELRNYDFCYGAGVNFYDLTKGVMYHIQEYKEAIERHENPKGIRVTRGGDPAQTIEWIDPVICKERMVDPEPDPRY